MKCVSISLVALLSLSCGSYLQPSPLYHGYSLESVDGVPPPIPVAEDGSVLLVGSLVFGGGSRPRADGAVDGTVRHRTIIRRPDFSQQDIGIDLDYSIREGVLRINLCPPLALCIVSTELVGPITGRTEPLVLTHYLAGNAGTVYRYSPALPE